MELVMNLSTMLIILFCNVAATARKLAKLSCRREPVEWLVANRKKDLQDFIGLVTQPVVQMGLEHYLESLKKKK
jgi:hypothetical protein